MTTIQGTSVGTEILIQSPQLSIVVPCHNESQRIASLHARCTTAARSVAGNSYELILVDDGSRDSTWQQMRALANSDSHVVAARLSRNFGHQLALSAGLELSAGARVLIIDADLQDPPELLPQMMQAMDQGADVVYGQRISRRGDSWFKLATAKLFYRLLRRLTDVEIPVDAGDFRLVTRRVVEPAGRHAGTAPLPARHGQLDWHAPGRRAL